MEKKDGQNVEFESSTLASPSAPSKFNYVLVFIYLIFLGFRLLFIFCQGYIHPDEFFQSPQVTSFSIFGFKDTFAWEFDPKFPCRTIVTPFFNTGIAFSILKFLQITDISCWMIQIFPRFILFFYSLIVDWCLYKLSKTFYQNVDPFSYLVLLSSSWVMIVFSTRPFSNTSEMTILTLCATIILTFDWKSNFIDSNLLGFLVALGIFTRFTFCFFIFPFGLFMLWSLSKEKSFSQQIFITGKLAFSFINSVSLFVLCDSLYFGSLQLTYLNHSFSDFGSFWHFFHTTDSFSWRNVKLLGNLVFTPLNSFLYNMDPANLEVHGLHPRILHLFVNFPMLYGPLAIIVILVLINRQYKTVADKTFMGCIVSGLFFLSLASHQEPRFLVPLVLPVVWLSLSVISRFKFLQVLWILFNLILATFFGILHQGGITPSLCFLQHNQAMEAPICNHVFYFHTYTPSAYLLCDPKGKLKVENLEGNSLDYLYEKLDETCSKKNLDCCVVTPETVSLRHDKKKPKSFSLIRQFFPHLSTEEFPPFDHKFLNHLNLNLYLYKK